MPGEPMLQMENIHKKFGSVVANAGVSLDVREGEIYALLGENGAGKSVLMNILCGVLTPDAGANPVQGPTAQARFAARGDPFTDWNGAPTFHARSEPDGGGKLRSRSRRAAEGVEPDEGGRGGHRRAEPSLRPRRPAGRSCARPFGRRASARRNSQDSLPGGGTPYSRRAHGGSDAGRDRPSARAGARARAGRQDRDLHLAQARRSDASQRARQRDARRKGGLHDADRGRRIRASSRERWSDERCSWTYPGARRRRAASFSRSRTCIAATIWDCWPCRAFPSRCAPGRLSALLAFPATDRASWRWR